MNKRQYTSVIKNIEKHMATIAKERDNLDEYIDTLSLLKEDCNNAYEHLQDARDALSDMV